MKFRSIMLTSMVLMGILGGSVNTTNAFPLIVNDEDVVPFTGMSTAGSVYTFNLTAPLLCANIGTPDPAAVVQIKPYFGSFVFGPYVPNTASDQGPAFKGVANMSFGTGPAARVTGDDATLVCYGLNANGTRKATRDLFADGFDPPTGFDSSVTVKVAELPSFGNNYTYKYNLDVEIPAVNSVSALTYILRTGFDAAVFSRTGQSWCLTVDGNPNQCAVTGTGNIDYPILLQPNVSFKRQFKVNSASLGNFVPNTGSPLVLAALFSPPVLREARLDNNVSAGFAAISNFAPVITASSPANIKEGEALTNIPFTLTDDAGETAGALIGATVKVDFNGTVVDANVDCGSSIPITTPPFSRNCHYSASPPSQDFATDITPGTYANGVHANIIIDAVDANGQHKTSTLSLHIASNDNDAPVATLSNVAVPDPTNNNIPTFTCSLSAPDPLPTSCVGLFPAFITGVAAGPAGAADELAMQTVNLNVDGSSGRNANIACPLDALPGGGQSPQIFSFSGGPRITPAQGSTSNYDLSYGLAGTNTGSATCTFSFSDNFSTPAKTPDLKFRIVVTQ